MQPSLGRGWVRARVRQCISPSFLMRPLRYSPKNPALQSETVHYKRGVSQQFSLPSFKIDFSEWKDDEVTSLRAGPRVPAREGAQCSGLLLRFLGGR